MHLMINISMSILPVIGWQGVTIQTFTHNPAKVYLYLYSNSENSAWVLAYWYIDQELREIAYHEKSVDRTINSEP